MGYAHNCVVVCATPPAPVNRTKTNVAREAKGFRPKISSQPAALAESQQIIGDARNGCCHNWNFHACKKEENTQPGRDKSLDHCKCRNPAERSPRPDAYEVKPPSFDIIN